MSEAEEIKRRRDALVEKYGDECITGYTLAFLSRLSTLQRLNALLAELDSSGDSEEYRELVDQIMAATREYYLQIGDMPEEVRVFLLGISEIGENRSLSGELLGMELPPDFSPRTSMQAIRPHNYIMHIDAITNQLASLSGHTALIVGRRGGQPVHTAVSLDMPGHMRIEGGHELSSYDKSILNGVTGLLESGNTVFSIPMLYHAMTGRQNPTVDEALYEELSAKLEKMRRMMLSIDLSQENEANFFIGEDGQPLKIENLTLERYLLPLNRITGVINGKKAELYQILQHPPLYTYAKMRRQLASVQISLLGAPVNNNSTTIPLKTYLMQRIELMKNKKNKMSQNTILYESIYRELGAEDAGKTKKIRIRSYTDTILQFLAEQGYIKGYAVIREGRAVHSVRIILPDSPS